MKKIITVSLLLFALVFLSGCDDKMFFQQKSQTSSISVETPTNQTELKETVIPTNSITQTQSTKPNSLVVQNTIPPTQTPQSGEDVAVFAAGGYEGVDTGMQIDDSGKNATKFDVYVNYKDKPVVLILGAYNPSIWNISVSEGTKISKIILGGYYGQEISGINKDSLSIEKHIYQDGNSDYFYIGDDTLKSSLKKFGDVEKIYRGNGGKIIIGDQNIENVNWIKDENNALENYFKKEDNLSGKAGLEFLVKKGFLRQATKEDADNRFNELIKSPKSFLSIKNGFPITDEDDLNILRKKYTPGYGEDFYVALKDFSLPGGMYWKFSFYIPKGIKILSGEISNGSIYDFNTLKCASFNCFGD